MRLCGNIRRGEGSSGRGREEVVTFQIICHNFSIFSNIDLQIISIIRMSQIPSAQNSLEVHMK